MYASEPQITSLVQDNPAGFILGWRAPTHIAAATNHAGPAYLVAVAVKEDGTEVALGVYQGDTSQGTGIIKLANTDGLAFRARVKIAAAMEDSAGPSMGPFSILSGLITFGRQQFP